MARVCAALGACVGLAAALIAIFPLAARMATIPEKREQVPAILVVGTVGFALATAGVIGSVIAPHRPMVAAVLLLISGCGGLIIFNPVIWFVPAMLQIVAAVVVWRGQHGHGE
jgi:hypothetical protein